ncbi:hypothetical protein [Clostridium sp.]|uniref:hypothetical protein n=1 Tax=Clostridium sp. TaxID=1506 RepID=UPI00261A0DB0|nr:hypothetical protein [Clostridium sp.]
MNINVKVEYLDDEGIEKFQEKAADILSSILIKKLQPKEIDELVEILKDESNKISW